jgi:hypothetical protein
MQLTGSRFKRLGGVVVLIAILAVATFALTASNTVPATKAGDGNNTITGYTVTAVHYTLNASNPQNVDSVSFTLDSAPVAGSTVKVQLDTPSGSWYSCTMSGTPADDASCTTTGATVAAADQLTVVAAD